MGWFVACVCLVIGWGWVDVIVRFCVIGLCGVCVLVCDCSLLFFMLLQELVALLCGFVLFWLMLGWLV